MLKIETTATDTIIKFVSDKILVEDKGSFEYNNVDDASNSKLVQQLFYLPFVKKVFVSANFIAVERYKIVEWSEVQNELNQMITNYLNTNGSLFDIKKEETSKKVAIQLYTESTPNPNVNKFVSNRLLSNQIIDVSRLDDLNEIPLAKELFDNFNAITEVFVSDNYISISKNDTVEWFEINTDLRSFILNYLQEQKLIITQNFVPKTIAGFKVNEKEFKDLDETSKEIISVLDEYIKPAVTADGGNILFQSYNADSKVVEVILQGACSGCPSATITLKNGIEATLKQILPNKISEVVAING